MVLVVGILVIWLTVLTVAVMILAAQVYNRAHVVAEERAAAAGCLSWCGTKCKASLTSLSAVSVRPHCRTLSEF